MPAATRTCRRCGRALPEADPARSSPGNIAVASIEDTPAYHSRAAAGTAPRIDAGTAPRIDAGDRSPAASGPGGFCSRAHQLEARRQGKALIAAGAGCRRCYRGGVFFDWRPDGGRSRSPSPDLASARVAVCWCPAGQRLSLESGHKPWGYMRDYGLEGLREIAPRTSPLARCVYGEGSVDADEEEE